MEKTNIVFVILHYNVIDETEKCIKSIKKNVDTTYEIIVVDNASPNQTGELLLENYKNDDKVTIILNQRNEGFSKGNNVGCKYAIENFHPIFLCVLNNDTQLISTNIFEILERKYNYEHFDILGPEIWNTVEKYNQNPSYQVSNIKEAKKKYRDTKIEYIATKYNLQLISGGYFRILSKIKETKKNKLNDGVQGSVIIFTENYYKKYEHVFLEKTFMYGEEAILNYRRVKDNLNLVFEFEIKFIHNHGISTSETTKNYRQKQKFQTKKIYEAARKTLLLFLEGN